MSSTLTACPYCDKGYKPKGMEVHIKAAHPEVNWPLTDNCNVCKKKIVVGRHSWADIGPPEGADVSVHIQCIGLGPMWDDFQEKLNKDLERIRNDRR